MGLRGFGASARREAAAKLKPRKLPWKRRGLTRVERVLAFLEFLPITKGKLIGHKMRLLAEQRAFIQDIYGRTDQNRVRIGVLSQPRGNGKTGLTAGLTLCHLLGPESEFRGECYSAAIDRQQAGLIADEMEAIILHIPEFAIAVNMKRWPYRTIEVLKGDGVGSKYHALSADARRGHGLAPSFWVYDELAQAPDRQLLDSLQTAMGKRKRSLGVIISTQAAEDDHPLSQIIDDGLKGFDKSIVVHLKSAPADADPFDRDVIRSVNPAFGKFLDADDVFAEADRAKRMPSFESAFRNLRLNQRIAADQRTMFMPPEVWRLGDGPVDEALFTSGRPVYGGLDLSARVDLTALVLACADDEGNVHLKPTAWTPIATVEERARRDRAPYDHWVRDGFLKTTPGSAIDYDFVAADIAAIVSSLNLVTIAFDDWHMNDLKAAFNRIGHSPPLTSFRQGFKSFARAVTELEVLAKEGKIRHGGHPVLRWCFHNTTMDIDPAGNRKPDKRKYFGRIDLAVASIMAVGELANRSEPFDAALWIA